MKVAINITSDNIDLDQINHDVYKFLGKEVDDNSIEVDYYICNAESEDIDIRLQFNFVHYSKLIPLPWEAITTTYNSQIIQKSKLFIEHYYRSYINAFKMHENIFHKRYSFVIMYDNDLKKYSMNSYNLKDFEPGFMFVEKVHQVILPSLNYRFVISSLTDFFKLVNVWRYVEYLADDNLRIWEWFKNNEDIGGQILGKWIRVQHIKRRWINDL